LAAAFAMVCVISTCAGFIVIAFLRVDMVVRGFLSLR
jgi:hypothetical protein